MTEVTQDDREAAAANILARVGQEQALYFSALGFTHRPKRPTESCRVPCDFTHHFQAQTEQHRRAK